MHRPAAALAELTATPLGLWLVRTVYTAPGADPTPLTDPDRFPTSATLQAHLLDQLIPALIDARPPSTNSAEPFRPRRRRHPAQVRHWLGYLAHHLTTQPATGGQGTRDLAWWRLAATTHTFTPTTRLTFASITTLTTGLAVGLATGLTFGLETGLAFGLVVGLAFGLVVGLATGLTTRSWAQDPPGYADLHIRRRSAALVRSLATRLPLGLAVAFAVAFAVGFAGQFAVGLVFGFPDDMARLAPEFPDGLRVGLEFELLIGVAVGLGVGLPLALALGIMAWAATPAPTHHATTPMSSWRTDRRLNLLRFSTTTLALALTITITLGLVTGLSDGLRYGLEFGPAVGLAFGLTVGLAFENIGLVGLPVRHLETGTGRSPASPSDALPGRLSPPRPATHGRSLLPVPPCRTPRPPRRNPPTHAQHRPTPPPPHLNETC